MTKMLTSPEVAAELPALKLHAKWVEMDDPAWAGWALSLNDGTGIYLDVPLGRQATPDELRTWLQAWLVANLVVA